MRGSPSYKNFEKKYIVFSRSFVDRTLGKEVFRIPVPVEKIYSGFFMSNHHEDLLVYTQNNRFVLYTYQDTGYTLFKELGEAIVLPVGSTFIDLTVGDFAHGDGYDEILLNTDKGLVTFINKGQVGARYFQMAGATVAGGDVSQRFLSTEPIQIQGPDAGDDDAEQIVYTKANGEMGIIFDLDFENTENNNIILRTGDESFDLDMSDTFADVHASGNDDDQSAMEYRKLFTRVPEAYISMVSFPEDMTMLQLPGYDASGSVEMRELAQEERVFVKTYKTSEMMVDGSEVVTTLDQLCPGYYPGVCDQVQYSSPMQCLDARAANPDFNFTQYADACARTVLHDHPELATPLEESDYSFFYKSNATASSEAFLSKYNYLKANADNALPEDENVSEKVSVAISFDYSSTINVGKQYLSSYAQDYVNYTPAEPTAPSHVVESQNDKQDEYWQDWAADIQPWVSLVWQAKQQADTDCQSAIDTYVDEDLCAPIIDEGQDACDNNPDTEAKKSAAENKVEMKQQYCSDPWNDIADFDEITEFFTTPDWADKSVRPEEEGVAHWYGTAAVVAYNALISVQSNTYLDPIWEDDQGQDLQNVWNTDIAPTLTVHEHTLGMLEAMNDGNSEAVSALGGAMRTSFVEFDWDCAADADDSQQQNCTLDVLSGPGMDLIAGQYAPDGSVIDIIIPGDDRMNIESVVASGSNLTMIDTISPVLHPNLVQTGSLLYDGKSHSERFALRILTKKSDLDTGLSIEVTGRLAQLPSPRLRVFDVDKTYASGSPADISGARENADYYPDIYIGEGETQHYFINQQDETFLYRIKDDAGFADSWEIISSPSVASLLPNSLNIFQKIWNAVVPFASASGGDAQKEKVNPPVSDRYKQANNKVIANMAADATDSVGSSKQMEWGSDVTDSFENLDEEAGSFEEEMDRWNEDLQEFKSYFKCSGGCVALPVNIAISMGVGSKNSYFAPTTPA
ncbi:MAG: hypothetical protein U9Q15_02810 [Patescibacteria group bacterium]|nr:hypothetical protein [Patescibacteria group bacterium]